ncbi:MAG: GNAT family N-acetyltransferase [Nocardioides sp.]
MVEFRVVDPASAPARWAMGEYFAEITAQFGFEVGTSLEDAASAYAAPRGRFVLAGPDDAPLACGAVHFLDEQRAEIKRMWVSADVRGRGVARALLAHLESLIVEAGRTESLLDTNSSLTSAVSLYESSGYQRVPDYNANRDADVWFAKPLVSGE